MTKENESTPELFPVLKAEAKNFKTNIPDGFYIFEQKYINYIPKITTRLRYIRRKKPLIFLQNTKPKTMDRRIQKIMVQVESIMSINLSIVCGSCRKLKNDCICEKSHYMIRCFVNLMGISNGVPIKLCIRKIGVLFSLLNFSPAEEICVLGYLISYDKLDYMGRKEFVKFTDIKYTSKFHFFFNIKF
jgi:hypothetical protein